MMRPMPVSIALAAVATVGAWAMGDVIYRKDPNKTLVSKGSMIGLFVPRIDIRQWSPDMPDFQYSIRISFVGTGPSAGGTIEGNTVSNWGSVIPSPCLTPDGRLDLLGTFVGPTNTWRGPQQLNPDTVAQAILSQAGALGDFDLNVFSEGECAYIAFADYTRSKFGYVQIERLDDSNASLWGLIGLSYDLSGAPVEVVDLRTVPVPATVVTVGAAVTMVGRRRRVACVV
jgi:hypothetical protein